MTDLEGTPSGCDLLLSVIDLMIVNGWQSNLNKQRVRAGLSCYHELQPLKGNEALQEVSYLFCQWLWGLWPQKA